MRGSALGSATKEEPLTLETMVTVAENDGAIMRLLAQPLHLVVSSARSHIAPEVTYKIW